MNQSGRDTRLKVCVVGHGMMGVWHTAALQGTGCELHTLVGRRPEPTRQFAEENGYGRWTVSLEDALADDALDVVILANPSEQHARTALQALEAGKHVLVEIPLALNLADAERVTARAKALGLTLGVVHPMRLRREMRALRARAAAGQETIRQVCGRFYIHRLENVGATGYQRSWTDNLLWHHTTHLLDFGLWMLDEPVRRVYGFMPAVDERTGTPMEAVVAVETEGNHALVCTGSYYGRERIFESLVVTDRDSYRLDVFGSTLTTGQGTTQAAGEAENCALVTRDFVEAVRQGRAPAVTGESVLPAMRVLEEVQAAWDAQHGPRSIPGRPA